MKFKLYRARLAGCFLATVCGFFGGGLAISNAVIAESPAFVAQELLTELQVGYAVRAVDMDGDGDPDLVIADSKRVLWLENPSWTEHVIYSTPDAAFDNVTIAAHDINGDGLVDLALGADWQFNNSDSGGSIGWLEQRPNGEWRYHSLANEPTTHRMNWFQLEQSFAPELVVAPLKGRGTRPPGFDQRGVRLLAFSPPENPVDETWGRRVLTEELHVMHNFEVTDLDRDGRRDIVAASYEGVSWLTFDDDGKVTVRRLGSGQEEPAPKRGASEIRHGRLAGGRDYLATIEPWHGDKVVVYLAPEEWPSNATARQPMLWRRMVLDDALAWGHAVATANLDDEPAEELIVGVRDDQSAEHRRGIRIYDPIDPEGTEWKRTLLDPGGVAVEDMIACDLDGDGDVDIIAVGRATHNVKIYWNQLVK
jgi:hypothetical protein